MCMMTCMHYCIRCLECGSEELSMDFCDAPEGCLIEHYRCVGCGGGFSVEYWLDR